MINITHQELGFEQLLAQIQENRYVGNKLLLNEWSLGAEQVLALMQALAKNTTITSLDLSSKKIDAKSLKELSKNKTIINLRLSNCDINVDVAAELAKNKKITSLDLSSNRLLNKKKIS